MEAPLSSVTRRKRQRLPLQPNCLCPVQYGRRALPRFLIVSFCSLGRSIVRHAVNTGRSVWRGLLSTSFFWLVVVAMPGCATMGTLTNLSDESCRLSFTRALSSVLSYEGEQPERSMVMASTTASTLLAYDLGPRPFVVVAPSGTDYRFFIDRKGTDCVLTLYGRQKGFVSYTNNATYIATKTLPDCTCAA